MNKIALIMVLIAIGAVYWLSASYNWRIGGSTGKTVDMSFDQPLMESPRFEKPVLRPELAGDRDYLYSLPIAKLKIFSNPNNRGGCTNSLKITRINLENSAGAEASFDIPLAYIRDINYRSSSTRKDYRGDYIPSISVMLPDFRPGCMRQYRGTRSVEDRIIGDEPLRYSGVYFKLSLPFNDGLPRTMDRLTQQYRGRFTTALGEVIPGLAAYIPPRTEREQSKYVEPALLLPIDRELSTRYSFRCDYDPATLAIRDYSCRGTGLIEGRLEYSFTINGYMHEWPTVLYGIERLIEHWQR
ncbi:MAG TPA: hypothetical protein DFI00_07190 [Rhodospirillaceae bacterium]|nr:hypothetical protein [Rhodospirillaceae bacterium]